jgi:hypothetical protein
VLGTWLKPGVHLDLVGAFTLDMRETDDEVRKPVGEGSHAESVEFVLGRPVNQWGIAGSARYMGLR